MKWWNTYRALAHMRRRLDWTPDQLRRYRTQRLCDLVKHVWAFSAFYQRFYGQAGISPEAIREESDLKRLPFLEKQHLLQTDPHEIAALPTASGDLAEVSWVTESTSGSTGRPLKIIRTWNDLYRYKAKEIRAFQQTGFRFYHRQVILKSSSDSVTGRHWFENFGILRKYWLSIRDPEEENLAKFRHIRPHHVHAYPSGLAALTECLEKRGETLSVPIICTGAEVLDAETRRRIQAAFQAEVFDFYGTREVGNIAWECRAHQGMHINDDCLIVELLDSQGREVPDGEEGEIVVTYLDGYDFPFLRYRLGDRAVRRSDPCACGSGFSRLEAIAGRSDSRIRLPSGVWISGMVFQELRAVPWAAAFRILQEQPESLRLQMVLRRDLQPGELEAFVAKVASLARGELRVIPEILPELEQDASGKYRCVICRLPETRPSTDLPSRGTP